MTKLLIGLLGAGVIATSGYAAATGLETDPARTVSLPAATSTDDTTTSATVPLNYGGMSFQVRALGSGGAELLSSNVATPAPGPAEAVWVGQGFDGWGRVHLSDSDLASVDQFASEEAIAGIIIPAKPER